MNAPTTKSRMLFNTPFNESHPAFITFVNDFMPDDTTSRAFPMDPFNFSPIPDIIPPAGPAPPPDAVVADTVGVAFFPMDPPNNLPSSPPLGAFANLPVVISLQRFVASSNCTFADPNNLPSNPPFPPTMPVILLNPFGIAPKTVLFNLRNGFQKPAAYITPAPMINLPILLSVSSEIDFISFHVVLKLSLNGSKDHVIIASPIAPNNLNRTLTGVNIKLIA